MSFEFATASRILVGEGRRHELPAIVRELGARALAVRGAGDHAASTVALLREAGLLVAEHVARGEPTVASALEGVDAARSAGADVVVAIGGGSVVDAGKAIAALLTNPAPPLEYLEVVGRGRPLDARPAPFVAVPTTAGTGAEVTRNAVLLVEEARVKVSLRSPLMLPTVALVDPELTYSLPAEITASTGLDALAQCLEPFVSPQANALSDAVAREGLMRAGRALARAVRDGGDLRARYDMSVASLCGGLALANARLGAVHGFAAPIGGRFPALHGVVCARLLAPIAAANVRALRARSPHAPALARYEEAARLLTGRTESRAEDASEWLAALVSSLPVPRLGAYGLNEAEISDVVALAKRASSMQGNPIALTDEELAEALRESF